MTPRTPAGPLLLELAFRQPAPLLSMNDRDHWRTRARYTKLWRAAACGSLLGAPIDGGRSRWAGPTPMLFPAAVVHVTLPVADSRRRDPHNYYPTIKAIVDGLVDAGLWPDDTPDYVTTSEPTLTVDRGSLGQHPTVTVTITTRSAA